VQLTLSIEVLDALGAFTLARRDGTLGGSVPLRAAQACSPMLEGNAYGLHLAPTKPFTLRRTFRGLVADDTFVRACKAVVPILRVRGLLTDDEAKRASLGIVRRKGSYELFTGLLVKSPKNVLLRLLSAQARASKALGIEPVTLSCAERLTPLFVRFSARAGLSLLRLESELATLAPISEPHIPVEEADDDAREALLRTHAAFYDRAYFDAKAQGEVTRKYRRMVARSQNHAGASVEAPHATLASFGVGVLQPDESGAILARAPFDFEAMFDGASVTIDADPRERRAYAEAVARSITPLLERLEHKHPGAQLYFSKYFTPHPHGEPHFFVKPPALLATPPGWSTLVEGRMFSASEVMRGVVSTDRFFAVPQVFHLFVPFTTERIRRGQELARLHLVPRGFAEITANIEKLDPFA
jgi:hypothetical protein